MKPLNSIFDERIKAYTENLKSLHGGEESITRPELDLIKADIEYLISLDYHKLADELKGLMAGLDVRNTVCSAVLYE